MPTKQITSRPSTADIIQLQEEEYSFPYHYVAKFRTGFSQCFNDSWGINYVSTIEFLLERLRKESFEKLVDIGCGDGRLTCEISRSFPSTEVVGIDYSTRAVNLARVMCPQPTYIAANIVVDEIGSTFDGAILMEVFEHIPLDLSESFVTSISNLLCPGGFLYVTVPHVNKSLERKHFRHFTSLTLSSCFDDHFHVADVYPFELDCTRRRVLEVILTNRFFILRNQRALNMIYRYYKNKLFSADETRCQRLFMKMTKR